MNVACITCSDQLDLPTGTLPGEVVDCPQCFSELEVLSLEPVALVLAPEADEDWGE